MRQISSVHCLPGWCGGTSEPCPDTPGVAKNVPRCPALHPAAGRPQGLLVASGPWTVPDTSIILDGHKWPGTATVAFQWGGGAANPACQPPWCTPNKPSSRICPPPPKTPAQKDGSPQTRGVLGKKHGAGRLPQPHWPGGADIPVGLAAKLNPTGDSGWVAEVCEQPRASGRLSPCRARPGGAAGWGLQAPRRGCREKPQNLESTKPANGSQRRKESRHAGPPGRLVISLVVFIPLSRRLSHCPGRRGSGRGAVPPARTPRDAAGGGSGRQLTRGAAAGWPRLQKQGGRDPALSRPRSGGIFWARHPQPAAPSPPWAPAACSCCSPWQGPARPSSGEPWDAPGVWLSPPGGVGVWETCAPRCWCDGGLQTPLAATPFPGPRPLPASR